MQKVQLAILMVPVANQSFLMYKYSTLIFDIDVIHDITGAVIDALQATISKLGLPYHSEKECMDIISLKKRVIELPEILFPESDIDNAIFTRTYFNILDEVITRGDIKLYPKVLETLQELKMRGINICMTSCKRKRDALNDFAKHTGLSSVISCIIGTDDVAECKPNPEAIYYILAKFHIRPDEAIIIGDTTFDLIVAKETGVPLCGITYRSGSRENLSDVKWIIDNFDDILPIIAG